MEYFNSEYWHAIASVFILSDKSFVNLVSFVLEFLNKVQMNSFCKQKISRPYQNETGMSVNNRFGYQKQ